MHRTARYLAMTNRGMRFLDSLVNFELRTLPDQTNPKEAFPIERMKDFLHNLGDPQKEMRAIQIAGSKGKGSVAAFLTSMFSASSLKAGCITSPHVIRVNERTATTTDGQDGVVQPISTEQLDALLTEHRPLIETMIQEGHEITYFETLVALALVHFARSGIAHVVMETGIGGETDATNCFEDGQVDGTVLCAMEAEHLGILGDNLDDVVRNEVSITRRHRPVIVAPQHTTEMQHRIFELCRSRECLLCDRIDKIVVKHRSYREIETTMVEELDIQIDKSLVEGADDLVFHGVQSRLIGQHQHQNIRTALFAALVADLQKWPLTEQAMKRGIEDAFVPGRMQTFRASPNSEWFLIDGAHTKHAARFFAQLLRTLFPNESIALVLCIGKGKQYGEILKEVIAVLPDVVVLTTYPLAKFLSPGELYAHWEDCETQFRRQQPFRCRKMIAANMATAILRARQELKGVLKPNAKSPGVIGVTGSLYGAGVALSFLEDERNDA